MEKWYREKNVVDSESEESEEEELCFPDTTQRPLVICGQPCTGKTTLINLLITEYPRAFVHVQHSTIERDNCNYNEAIRDVTSRGQVCVLESDMQGVANLKKLKKSDLDPIFFFIKVPSLKEFEKRLRKRATDSEETIQNILSQYEEYDDLNAKRFGYYKELESIYFDFVLENDYLKSAYSDFQSELYCFFKEYELYEDLSSDAYKILAKELTQVLGTKTLDPHQFDFGWGTPSEWQEKKSLEALERVRNLTLNALCEPFNQAKACQIEDPDNRYSRDEPDICGNMAWTVIEGDLYGCSHYSDKIILCNRHLRELVYDDKKSFADEHFHNMSCQCRCCRC